MPPQEVTHSPEEEERLAAAIARYDELVGKLEENAPRETVAELDRLGEEIRSISEPAMAARAEELLGNRPWLLDMLRLPNPAAN